MATGKEMCLSIDLLQRRPCSLARYPRCVFPLELLLSASEMVGSVQMNETAGLR